MNTETLEKAEQVVFLLKQNNLKIATAESCTGGMVSAYITAVSGASSVLELGITSYSNRIKNKILKVKSQTLKDYGAISQDTAEQMAQNVKNIANADIGVSVTGAAGPDSSEGHNAGFVIIALCYKDKTTVKQLNINPKSRSYVREQAVFQLFELIINFLKEVNQ